MALNLTQDVMRTLRNTFKNQPDALTKFERLLADRICHCIHCKNLWLQRTKRYPRQCPKCKSRTWDAPLLELMQQNGSNRNVDASTKHARQNRQFPPPPLPKTPGE